METLYHYVAPPSPCGYLQDQTWRLEYEMTQDMSALEYQQRLLTGWRRFGAMVFRPRCPQCSACRSLRVKVSDFRPNRSQRRTVKMNAGEVECVVGSPSVTRRKLQLYDSYHAFQSDAKGWPEHPAKDPASYANSFVDNPFDTEEWCYLLDDRLVGVGYVDVLPSAMSAIYFYYDPAERHRSLGTWNVLSLIDECQARDMPYLYLGYYVAGCRSLEYKGNFRPNQARAADGRWVDFLT
jgi:arginyl-tRNA--protein-N-Asp/Glu arginylyltransferase